MAFSIEDRIGAEASWGDCKNTFDDSICVSSHLIARGTRRGHFENVRMLAYEGEWRAVKESNLHFNALDAPHVYFDDQLRLKCNIQIPSIVTM